MEFVSTINKQDFLRSSIRLVKATSLIVLLFKGIKKCIKCIKAGADARLIELRGTSEKKGGTTYCDTVLTCIQHMYRQCTSFI